MLSPLPAPPHARTSVSDTLAELLTAAGVGKTDTIQVTGHYGLAAILWFCRHGYQQVGYQRVGRGPHESGDLLIVPQTCSLAALQNILNLGPHPRAGGVLIVPTVANGEGEADPVCRLLQREGYQIERCLRGRHRALVVARRSGRTARRLAA